MRKNIGFQTIDWTKAVRAPFDAFHKARQTMQQQMDTSIAVHADHEVLYDQPQTDINKLRISGPFTIEGSRIQVKKNIRAELNEDLSVSTTAPSLSPSKRAKTARSR